MKRNNRHVLMICSDMIPYTNSFGASQRVFYFAENLIANGFKVSVFADKNTNIANWYGKQPSFQIFHLEGLFSKGIFFLKNEQSTTRKRKKKYQFSILSVLKKTAGLFDKYFFNDPNPGSGLISYLWLKFNEKTIINFVSVNSIDHVIISMPPFGLASYSLIAKLHKQSCIVVLDYRDPWNCWNGNRGIPFFKEKKALLIADYVFTTNEKHKSKLVENYSLNGNKIKSIMNGYDSDLWETVEKSYFHKKNKKLTFCFIGNISFKQKSYRNPTEFFEAYSRFANAKNIIIRFVGIATDSPDVKRIMNLYPEIQFIPKVSQHESFVQMLKSDVLFNIHSTDDNSSEYLMAGKIFDYYRSKRFILSINSERSLENQFVLKHKIGLCTENYSDKILQAINSIYNQWRINENNLIIDGDFSYLDHYTRTHQGEILSEWCKNN